MISRICNSLRKALPITVACMGAQACFYNPTESLGPIGEASTNSTGETSMSPTGEIATTSSAAAPTTSTGETLMTSTDEVLMTSTGEMVKPASPPASVATRPTMPRMVPGLPICSDPKPARLQRPPTESTFKARNSYAWRLSETLPIVRCEGLVPADESVG